MDEALKCKILEHLANLAFNIQSFEDIRPPSNSSIFVTRESGTEEEVILTGDLYEEFDDLLKLLLEKAGWDERVSQQYLDKRLKNLITTIRKDGQAKEVKDLAPYFDQLIAELNSFDTQSVCIPVLGIKTDIDAFPVGNFTFRRFTKELTNKLAKKYREIYSSKNSEPIEESKVESFGRNLDIFRDTIVAERAFDYPIEASRALEIAEEELRRVIDLFRYVIAWMHPHRNVESKDRRRPLIGLQGEVHQGTRTTFIFSKTRIGSEEKLIGPLEPLYLSAADLYNYGQMEQIGFFLMSNVLGKPLAELSPYQEMLIRSLRLFSDSQTQYERETEFLGMFNCIENFTNPDQKIDGISKTIAFLIADTPDEREQLRNEYREKYKTRNKITHGSRQIVILNDDLKSLRTATLKVICWMIHHDEKFETDDDLRKWLEEERLKIWPDGSASKK
jgi:hypothetical protein